MLQRTSRYYYYSNYIIFMCYTSHLICLSRIFLYFFCPQSFYFSCTFISSSISFFPLLCHLFPCLITYFPVPYRFFSFAHTDILIFRNLLSKSLYSPNLCYFSSHYMAPFFLFIAYEANPPFTVSPPSAPLLQSANSYYSQPSYSHIPIRPTVSSLFHFKLLHNVCNPLSFCLWVIYMYIRPV